MMLDYIYNVYHTDHLKDFYNTGLAYSTLQVYQRSYSQVRHIPPKMSDKFESQHSLSLFGRTFWSDVRVDIKRFFYTFLEVNMSNIL
jgi:hypothetical protein